MTYSEFGRRIKSNDSRGTDHGAAAPLIVFGTQVNPTIIGNNPNIPSTVSVEDNIPMQYDFRQIYASVLIDWFQTPSTKTDSSLLLKHFDTLPIFKQGLWVKNFRAEQISLLQNYPNPFKDFTSIEYSVPSGKVELKLFDSRGRLIKTLVNQTMEKGTYNYNLDGHDLAPGNYYYQLISPNGQIGRHLVKI